MHARRFSLVMIGTVFCGFALAAPTAASTALPAPDDTPLVEALTHPASSEPVTPAELGLPAPGDPRLAEGLTVSTDPTSTVLNRSPRVPSGYTTASAGLSFNVVGCTGEVQNPHYSAGAGGAIAKIRMTCSGTGYSTVNVRVRGLLSFSPSSYQTLQPRASLDETRAIAVNGGTVTFYLPGVGSNGGTGNGYWAATATWQIVAPGVGNSAEQTRFFHGNINRPGVV